MLSSNDIEDTYLTKKVSIAKLMRICTIPSKLWIIRIPFWNSSLLIGKRLINFDK